MISNMTNPIYFVITIQSVKILLQGSIVRRGYALMLLAVEFIYMMFLPIKQKECIALEVTIHQPNSNDAFSCETLQFFKCTPTIKIQRDSSSESRRFPRHKAAAVNVFTSFEVVLSIEDLSHPRRGLSGFPRTLTRKIGLHRVYGLKFRDMASKMFNLRDLGHKLSTPSSVFLSSFFFFFFGSSARTLTQRRKRIDSYPQIM